MHLFKDGKGRDWHVEINAWTVGRVRDLLSIDLPGLVASDGFKALAEFENDSVKLVNVLYVLCREQADKDGVTAEMFGRAMYGDALESGALAIRGELVDFSRNPRQRAALARVFDAATKLQQRMMERAETELGQIDLDDLERKLISSSGSLPVSSGFTPDPSHSGSST